ncbi:hypothetical protein ACKWTF_013007 [Chironomus riparius]
MSISAFRKKKLLYVFNVFFDINNSGEIDKKDFEIAIQKICDLRGWPAGSPKNTETHEVMFKIWEGLRSKADKDNDGQVSYNYNVFNVVETTTILCFNLVCPFRCCCCC